MPSNKELDLGVVNQNSIPHVGEMAQEENITISTKTAAEQTNNTSIEVAPAREHAEQMNNVSIEVAPTGEYEAQVNTTEPDPEPISPEHMGPAIQQQGMQLQEVLRMFKNTTTSPLSSAILATPSSNKKAEAVISEKENVSVPRTRESSRLKAKGIKGQNMIKIAQNLVTKKYGILQEHESLDEMTLQDYLNMYKQPLTETSVEAIMKLTEVAVEKKKKKKKKKKKSMPTAKLNQKLVFGKKLPKCKKVKNPIATDEATTNA